MSARSRFAIFAVAALVLLVVGFAPWPMPSQPSAPVRRATGIVLATLVLWISEAAPLGVVALGIPVAATLAGLLRWDEAVASWGDPVLLLFLGAFLLARALDKHGVIDDWLLAHWSRPGARRSVARQTVGVLFVAGAISSLQNNTAVTAMLLPVVARLARRSAAPALPLLALTYGATLGGMATPVGTAPNFIGFAAMKSLDAEVNFVMWLRVGIPVWAGTSLLAFGLLTLARRLSPAVLIARPDADEPADALAAAPVRAVERVVSADASVGYARPPADAARIAAQRWAVAAFAVTALVWLTCGAVLSVFDASHPASAFVKRYLPESLIPIAAACVLFLMPAGSRGKTVLDRHDFQALDWDTLFLIAGGLCLGRMLGASGAADALAASVGGAALPPLLMMLLLGGATVLLSELTSNTATASLLVPIAQALAPPLGIPPTHAIWLVALCASLGFALPISTPPNAIVYGTRLVPLRLMVLVGVALDVLTLIWVVACVRWLA